MALPQRLTELEPLTDAQTARIRRCTYRKLSRVEVSGKSGYEVSCLYPDRRLPVPLGDAESSLAICRTCRADHIFRPDED